MEEQEKSESEDKLEITNGKIPDSSSPCTSSGGDRPSALVSPYVYSKDVCDSGAQPGQCGLYNLGNTCFMNSGLQSLLATSPLVKYFLEQFSPEEPQVDTLTTNFHQLICKVWSGRYSIIYPRDFKNALGLFHAQFQDYRQHDAQEFLALFLDTMHQQMNLKESENQIQYDSDTEDDCTNDQSKQSQLNNSLISRSTSGGQNVMSAKTECINAKDDSCVAQPCQTDEDSNVSFVIQSELPTLLKSVVRTSSESDLEPLSHEVDEPNELEPLLNNASNLKQRIPKIQEFYSKDTKTLNTNVVIGNYNEEVLTTDSVKFHKQDNNHIEVDDLNVLAESHDRGLETVKDESPRKGIKDTNIQADKNKKVSMSADTDSENENSIKKMKFECTEKNFHYQALSKIKKDFDCTEHNLQLASLGGDGVKLIKDLGILGSLDKELCDSMRHNTTFLSGSRNTEAMKPAEGACNNKSEICLIENQTSEKNEISKKKSNEAMVSKMMTSKLAADFSEDCTPTFKKIQSASTGDCEVTENSNTEWRDSRMEDEDIAIDDRGHTMEINEAEEEAADKAWEAYVKDNHSVVVSTFQGQFKSTVICSECNHVSVTFEPFMYLSVPLPHATDRQLCIMFIPFGELPTQYLVTLTKSDKIKKVKEELRKLTKMRDCEMLVAEVLDGHISRILEDNVMLRYVNDKTRQIYCFEMIPTSQSSQEDIVIKEAQAHTVEDVFSSMGTFTKEDTQAVNTFIPPSTYQNQSIINDNIPNPKNTCQNAESAIQNSETSLGWDSADNSQVSGCMNQGDWIEEQFRRAEVQSDWLTDEQFALSVMKTDWLTSGSNEFRNSLNSVNMDCSGTAAWSEKSGHVSAGRNSPVTENTSDSCSMSWEQSKIIQEGPAIAQPSEWIESSGTPSSDVATLTVVTGTWKSCAICLEELEDSQLLSHCVCSGTFCHTCLEMSLKHYGEESYHCPVCFNKASLTEDFVPLEENSGSQHHVIRILPVSVCIRTECDDSLKLVGHPRTIYLLSSVDGEQLYSSVAQAVPGLSDYTIVLTDGQGLHCSRCLYTYQCQGCPVPCEGEVRLRPGDSLTISLKNLSSEQLEMLDEYSVDFSMKSLRPEKPLSIYDCLKAFTDSEILDEHNPWYCPRCQRNQCAKKTITVWQYPDILIVHLKRFVYHELNSTKVDAEVIFPLDDLNLSHMISGPDVGNLSYNLFSIICHFGGASAGHYTTFSKHPFDAEWYYYNDEMVAKESPKQEDYKNAYILFYNRKGCEAMFDIPSLPPEVNLNPSCSSESCTDISSQLTQTLNNRQENSSHAKCVSDRAQEVDNTEPSSSGTFSLDLVEQHEQNNVKIIITDCYDKHSHY